MNSDKPFLVLCERKMVPIKRRLNKKPIRVKCKTLKDLEKGMTNEDVEAKDGVPKNSLSAWVKIDNFFGKQRNAFFTRKDTLWEQRPNR